MEPKILFLEILLFDFKTTAKVSRSKRRRLSKKKAKAFAQDLGVESSVRTHPTTDGSEERVVMPATLGKDIDAVLERKTEISMLFLATSPAQMVSLPVEAVALAKFHHPSLNANPTDYRRRTHSLATAAQPITDVPLTMKEKETGVLF